MKAADFALLRDRPLFLPKILWTAAPKAGGFHGAAAGAFRLAVFPQGPPPYRR